MHINKKCPLVMSAVYYYDIPACNYNLLKYTEKDLLKDIDFENKLKRNIQIGLLQQQNNYIKTILRTDVNNIINHYIKINKLSKDNIILKAKDGFICDKNLLYTKEGINIILKKKISKLIIDNTRRKYLAIDFNGSIEVRGLINKPKDISFLNFFNKLDFGNINKLLHLIEENRKIFFKSNNLNYFIRETKDNMVTIPLNDMGFLTLKKSDLDIIDINQVNKKTIWDEYIWPFCQSLLLHTVKQTQVRSKNEYSR